MKTIKLNGGIELSEIALGAGRRGPIEKDEVCFPVIDRYMEYGGRTFDSARMYAGGQSDAALGRWLRSRKIDRSSVTLVMKGCHPADPAQMHLSRLSPEEIAFDLEESLRVAGTDYADLYLLHRDNPRLPVSDIMIALDRLVREGKTRAVGCSNWTIGRIIEANEFAEANGLHKMTLCQLHFSLAETTAAQTRDITHVPMSNVEFGWYKETGFPIMGFGPQGRGYFHRKLSGLPASEGDTRYYDYIPENRRRAERLGKLAKETGHSPASLLIAYSRDNSLNCEPLSAFSSVAQLDDAFGALSFTLTKDQIHYLETGE